MTPSATLLKPGGRVAAYVRSTGAVDGEDHFATTGMLVTSINAGLARCRAGQNDIVYVLPGHTETFTAADSLTFVAGAQVIAVGRLGATNNPTLLWNNTAATVLMNDANCSLIGFNMDFTGVDAVVAPITISAAGCMLACNLITVAGGSEGATTPVTVALGADNCFILGNKMLATGTQTEVNIISITGAVDNLEIAGNSISCLLTSATGGIIQIGAAATNLDIHHNLFYNSVEDGVCIRVADTFAATGWVYNNYGKTIDAGGTVANTVKLISFEGTTESLIGCFENYATDEAVASGALSPAIATT